MALSGIDMALSLPLSLYQLIERLMVTHSYPWVSWDDAHQYGHEVWTFTNEEMLKTPMLKVGFDLNRWVLPGCAFLFFAFFGLSSEAMCQYKRILWQIVAPFGFKPSGPGPEYQMSSWPRRVAARVTRTNHSTFSSEACTNADVGQSSANPATEQDDKLDPTPQGLIKPELRDLESQK
ncbi:a-factor receptor [Ceratobasidium sp. 392]|nr:a-factor receptor [Ceratobasidium sp. 392]